MWLLQSADDSNVMQRSRMDSRCKERDEIMKHSRSQAEKSDGGINLKQLK